MGSPMKPAAETMEAEIKSPGIGSPVVSKSSLKNAQVQRISRSKDQKDRLKFKKRYGLLSGNNYSGKRNTSAEKFATFGGG